MATTRLGFTGSRRGMTAEQRTCLSIVLYRFATPAELHHGDCVGSDEIACRIAKSRGFRLISHPSTLRLRAYITSDENYAPLNTEARNRVIAKSVELLIATPFTNEEEASGTWQTMRIAHKAGTEVLVIFPNGDMRNMVKVMESEIPVEERRCGNCSKFAITGAYPWTVNRCMSGGISYPNEDESCSRWEPKERK